VPSVTIPTTFFKYVYTFELQFFLKNSNVKYLDLWFYKIYN
jgi:hypothetical protein